MTVELIEPIGVLMKLLERHSNKGYRKPKMFPRTLREAAQYWIDHQEAPDDYKEAVTELTKNGELTGYDTPYHDRLTRTLRIFLLLPHIHQEFVIDCVEKGMVYRGEDMRIYPEIAKQYQIMWKDPEKYNADASKHLRMWE